MCVYIFIILKNKNFFFAVPVLLTKKLLAKCCKQPGWGEGIAIYKKAKNMKLK